MPTDTRPAGAKGKVNGTDARLWHPWLRINRVPARDAAHALERGWVVRRPHRVQAGARAAERDPAHVTLLAELEEFLRDRRPRGGLTGDATEPASNGYRLTVACACGVVFERWVTPEDADVDLSRWAALN